MMPPEAFDRRWFTEEAEDYALRIWDEISVEIEALLGDDENADPRRVALAVVSKLFGARRDIRGVLVLRLARDVRQTQRNRARWRERHIQFDAETTRRREDDEAQSALLAAEPWRDPWGREFRRWLSTLEGDRWLHGPEGKAWKQGAGAKWWQSEQEWSRAQREREQKLAADLARVTNEYKRAVQIETLEALFDTQFALRDGRRVTWGEATIADHEARIAMLLQHAAGTVETASRHQAAVDLLRERGVARLNELRALERTA